MRDHIALAFFLAPYASLVVISGMYAGVRLRRWMAKR